MLTIIINKIVTYVNEHGGVNNSWYVGITADQDQRLFNGHNVNREDDLWIWQEAKNAGEARSIEDHLVNVLRFDGGTGGGDENSKFVYAYKKSSNTRERT